MSDSDGPAMTSTAPRLGRGRGRLRLLSLLVLVVLVGGALGAFAVSSRVVNDQEQRLLEERTDEVQLLLVNSFGSIESSLRMLGPIGASPNPAAVALFAQSAGPLTKGTASTVGVAVKNGGGFAVVAAVGDGPAKGASWPAGALRWRPAPSRSAHPSWCPT